MDTSKQPAAACRPTSHLVESLGYLQYDRLKPYADDRCAVAYPAARRSLVALHFWQEVVSRIKSTDRRILLHILVLVRKKTKDQVPGV